MTPIPNIMPNKKSLADSEIFVYKFIAKFMLKIIPKINH